jgi:YVTN family beta-propeller protein
MSRHWRHQCRGRYETLILFFCEELTMTTVHVVQRFLTILAIPLLVTLPLAAQNQVRILQSNAAGDRVHIIDPVTNKVVGEIPGIEAAHGVTASPDASRIYVSNEADDTLDVADARTLKVIKKIPLSGRPNNISISPDGRRVYVGIRQAVGNNPGVADVIDTASLAKIKSIRTEGPVHNLYVTPDGKNVVAGDASENGYVSVLDTQTDAPAWSVKLGHNIRPMAMSKNPDGSTRSVFVQIGTFNGFVVVDFKTRKEVARITLPKLAAGRIPLITGSSESHGLAVTSDQKILVVCSRLNNALYSYSLPDLKLLGTANLSGKGAAWVTLTPDGKRAYVADPVGNSTLVVDIPTMKEVAKIPVGQVPKRNHTMVIPARSTNE